MSNTGRTIAVTGATGGIGAAVVRRLASRGANVIALDLEQQALDDQVTALAVEGWSVLGRVADTTDEDAMAAALRAGVEHFGRLDGMVAAAGIDHPRVSVLDVDLDLWERVHHVNLTGAFVACRTAAREMREHGGAIVTIGSVSATTARIGKVPYCSSKAGILGLTRTLALELADLGVRVNCVCPGPTDTPMVAAAVAASGPEVLQRRIRGSIEDFRVGIPLRRLGTPDEQAAAIAFALSPDAGFMTGAVINVDGGVTTV